MKLASLVVFAACGTPKPAPTTPAKFEMQTYQLVLLRRGPAWTPEETPDTKRIFERHMANIQAMAAKCKLVVAGPIDSPQTDRTALAGIFVFDAPRAEVDELLKHDPAVEIGRLVPEIHVWYSDAQHAKRCKPH